MQPNHLIFFLIFLKNSWEKKWKIVGEGTVIASLPGNSQGIFFLFKDQRSKLQALKYFLAIANRLQEALEK
jgi:hypothetical protein